MKKNFVILEIQDGDPAWVFFANAWAGDPAHCYTEEEAAREVDSYIKARPSSRFLVVNIAPNLGFEGAL